MPVVVLIGNLPCMKVSLYTHCMWDKGNLQARVDRFSHCIACLYTPPLPPPPTQPYTTCLLSYTMHTRVQWFGLYLRQTKWPALQRHKTENSIQIFPEKEMREPQSQFHIKVSLSGLDILRIGLSILLQKNMWVLGIYKSLMKQTHECGNWDWGRAFPFLGIHKWVFCCSVGESIGPIWKEKTHLEQPLYYFLWI